MKISRYCLILLLLFPLQYQKIQCEWEYYIAGGCLAAIAAIGAPLIYLITKKEKTVNNPEEQLLVETQKLCNIIKHCYDIELKIEEQYRTNLFHNNQNKYSPIAQENLRRDIVERIMSRGTGLVVDKPLHYQDNIMNTEVIKNLNEKIKLMRSILAKIEAKLITTQKENEKKKLLELKQKYLKAKESCEDLKKSFETIRGAIMVSAAYNRERFAATDKSVQTKNEPTHSQQQEYMNQSVHA